MLTRQSNIVKAESYPFPALHVNDNLVSLDIHSTWDFFILREEDMPPRTPATHGTRPRIVQIQNRIISGSLVSENALFRFSVFLHGSVVIQMVRGKVQNNTYMRAFSKGL